MYAFVVFLRKMLAQDQTPLLDALKTDAECSQACFYTPGHKQGQGISQKIANVFGTAVFRADLPELRDTAAIQQAQELAARAFGAEKTWFLVNGSTCGIEAAILATCGPGDKIILPRNVHSAAIAGLILSGAVPIFVYPEYDFGLDNAHCIAADAVAAALSKHPDAKAVMVVYPTYYGVCGDLKAIARVTHQYDIPLLVDEAHGAHFAFHPELPAPALAAGADLTVQSAHKTLAAFTQASMLHVQGTRIDRDRLEKALQFLQSTSPSYLLLASLDAARQQMALYGKQLMSHALQLAQQARNQIGEIPGISVFDLTCKQQKSQVSPGFAALDKTRLTVDVSKLGLTGFRAAEILEQDFGVTAELASPRHLTFIISLGNTQKDIEKLVEAFTYLGQEKEELGVASLPCFWDNANKVGDCLAVSPREAFLAKTEILPLQQTPGRICAVIVCPYPPGIPVLMPGEVISKSRLEYLLCIQAMGGFISGCADASLKNLRVLQM